MPETETNSFDINPSAEKWAYRGSLTVIAGLAVGLTGHAVDSMYDLPNVIETATKVSAWSTIAAGYLLAQSAIIKDIATGDRP